ncbi:uncharacterized protein LOC128723298 [Anopheles nili]|uniref:uncharacterized protein LOC128723298 n=1 Tax=Anopheles nili TaxID=185578 RepID=UPI00237C3380|nr:uncharacterized protein LOC128723298 [Anopheles nili]
MYLLLTGAYLLLLASTGDARSGPLGKKPEVMVVMMQPPESSTYSPMADFGRLAQGATGFLGQFWNTGTRLGGELSRRTFDFLKVKK